MEGRGEATGEPMRPDLLELDELPPLPPVTPVLSPLDIEAALLAVTGGSVVDWTALRFTSHDEVNSFLALWKCDVSRHAWARERLRYLYNQAVNYLEEHVRLTIRPDVRRPDDVRDAFLAASERERFSRDRIQYCAVLKLMHVINHLEMQELRAQVAVRDVDLTQLAYDVVLGRADQMRRGGFPLRAFYGNRKSRPSVITKLLAKREATAATIFDKLRFRVVTERREDLIPAIAWLCRHLVPFPAITPGESHNNLLSADELHDLARLVPGFALPEVQPINPHSGAVYRVINFIAELPVCVYDVPGVAPPKNRALLGEAVMISIEFQLVDAETDALNESGESRHDLYKERQAVRVYERLGRKRGKQGR